MSTLVEVPVTTASGTTAVVARTAAGAVIRPPGSPVCQRCAIARTQRVSLRILAADDHGQPPLRTPTPRPRPDTPNQEIPMTDPRPALYRALDQLVDLATTTADHDLDRPTPCAGWDVRTLLGHALTVELRLAHVARGGAPHDVPHVTEMPDADRAAALTDARDDLHRVWDDDAVLDRALVLPWATMPGRAAAAAYVQEAVAHAWDLAVATGRLDALDPALARDCLATAEQAVPAEGREDIPFGPVVVVPDDAGPYERLVAWFGRDPEADPYRAPDRTGEHR